MKKRVKHLSMQRRMMLSFALPVILAVVVISGIIYGLFLKMYEKQTKYSIEQSYSQATSFVENYTQTMRYLAEMMENNGEIRSILSSSDYNSSTKLDEQFRQFFRLKQVLMSYELSNPIYRMVLYAPDEMIFAENHYYVYEESRITKRVDYGSMNIAFSRGQTYLAQSTELQAVNETDKQEMITLFARIPVSDESDQGLGYCSVSVSTKRFRQIMKNANVIPGGITYLIDRVGNVLASSDTKEVIKLRKDRNFPIDGEESSWQRIQLQNQEYYMMRSTAEGQSWQTISLIPVENYKSQYRFIEIWVLGILIVIGILIFTVSGKLSRSYIGRLTALKQKMNSLQGGNLNVQLPLDEEGQGDEIDEVYRNFNFMVEEVRRLMQDQYLLGKNVRVAELRALQAQINPHFLYNTLDLINWIAMDYGASDIEKITWNLARFYRLSLNHGKTVISMEEELEHAQVYVNIQNFHYDHAITFQTFLPEELKNMACLNIIMQPFVENSIVHGIGEHVEIESCHIEIHVLRKEDQVEVVICDDGPGMSDDQREQVVSEDKKMLTKGYGIKNINFRIKLCFGEKYGVFYEDTEGKGTKARILLPALTVEEAEQIIV